MWKKKRLTDSFTHVTCTSLTQQHTKSNFRATKTRNSSKERQCETKKQNCSCQKNKHKKTAPKNNRRNEKSYKITTSLSQLVLFQHHHLHLPSQSQSLIQFQSQFPSPLPPHFLDQVTFSSYYFYPN